MSHSDAVPVSVMLTTSFAVGTLHNLADAAFLFRHHRDKRPFGHVPNADHLGRTFTVGIAAFVDGDGAASVGRKLRFHNRGLLVAKLGVVLPVVRSKSWGRVPRQTLLPATVRRKLDALAFFDELHPVFDGVPDADLVHRFGPFDKHIASARAKRTSVVPSASAPRSSASMRPVAMSHSWIKSVGLAPRLTVSSLRPSLLSRVTLTSIAGRLARTAPRSASQICTWLRLSIE